MMKVRMMALRKEEVMMMKALASRIIVSAHMYVLSSDYNLHMC